MLRINLEGLGPLAEKMENFKQTVIQARSEELIDVMDDWQDDVFNRNKPNTEYSTNGPRHTVSTLFWDKASAPTPTGKVRKRRSLARSVKKLRLNVAVQTQRRTRLARSILRPEVVVDLYARALHMVRETIRWPQ